MTREPRQLARGKAFNALVQEFYGSGAGAAYGCEQAVRRARLIDRPANFDPEQPWRYLAEEKARGRMDGFLIISASEYGVHETKCTDWDVLDSRGTLGRNLARHTRQAWRYLEGVACWTEPATGEERWIDLSTVTDRYTAIVYPRTPATDRVKEIVVDGLGEWGCSPVWFDKPPPADSPGWEAWQAIGVEARLARMLQE